MGEMTEDHKRAVFDRRRGLSQGQRGPRDSLAGQNLEYPQLAHFSSKEISNVKILDDFEF